MAAIIGTSGGAIVTTGGLVMEVAVSMATRDFRPIQGFDLKYDKNDMIKVSRM